MLEEKTSLALRRRAAVVNLAFHWLGAGLLVVQGLLVTPVYARLIPLTLLGAWMATGNLLAWLTLIDPNISKVLQQRVARALGQGDHEAVRSLAEAGHVLGLGIGSALSLFAPILPILVGMVPGSESGRSELQSALVVALVATSVLIASFGPTTVNLGLQRTAVAGLISVLATLVGIGVTLTGLLDGWGLVALPAGLLCRATVLLAGNLIQVYLELGWRRPLHVFPARVAILEILAPSGFTLLERVGLAMTSQIEPLAIAFAAGPSVTAQYSITGRPLEPVRMAVDRVLPALSPGLSHLEGERGKEAVAGIVARIYGPLGGMASIGMAAVTVASGPLVQAWAGSATYAGYAIAGAVGAAALSASLAAPAGEVLYALGDVRSVALGRIIEGVCRVVLQVLGGFCLGAIGVIIGGATGTTLVAMTWMNPRAEQAMGLRRREMNRRYVRVLGGGIASIALAACVGGGVFAGDLAARRHWNLPLAVLLSLTIGTLGVTFWPGLRREVAAEIRGLRGA